MNETPRLMRTFPAAEGEQVVPANRREDPYNRWVFRNLRRMLPTGNVWSGDGTVTDLPVQPLYLDDIAFADKNGAGRPQAVRRHVPGLQGHRSCALGLSR